MHQHDLPGLAMRCRVREDAGRAGRATAHPSAVASPRPGGGAASHPSGSARPTDRPAIAQDTEAHCRAYDRVQGRGKALGATAWQRLVAAAGGTDKVAVYCSEQLTRETAKPSHSAGAGKSGKRAANSANGTAGGTSASGNASANSEANGGQGKGKKK
ncbi:hypothetical protein [Streptomyces sp. NPDC054804]